MSNKYLIMTLIAPMASFGELSGHERRPSRERPGKAAIMGLIGAALGIRRGDKAGQDALANGYDVAVRVEKPGTVMTDFHTAQAVPTTRSKKPDTRANALQTLQRGDNPVLTRREYRLNAEHYVAVSKIPEARWSLEDIAVALKAPGFNLYLGRKSCPLAHPVNPRIVETNSIVTALEDHFCDEALEALRNKRYQSSQVSFFTPFLALSKHQFDQLNLSNRNTRVERVNDQPIDREKWHFSERYEVILPVVKESEANQ